MSDTKNAFDPRRFVLDSGYAEGKTGRKIKGKRVVFNDDGTYSPAIQKQARQTAGESCWVAFYYKDQLELARQTRNALLAVQAEISRFYFRAWDKSVPIEFSNSVLRNLGFNRRDKLRALRSLESAGWISVRWRYRKSPLVTIRQGFHLFP